MRRLGICESKGMHKHVYDADAQHRRREIGLTYVAPLFQPVSVKCKTTQPTLVCKHKIATGSLLSGHGYC
jgi:hypothetical protein